MKQPVHIDIYDTTSTELAAALTALGYNLTGPEQADPITGGVKKADPIRRIFTEKRPINRAVSHGLKRGGEVQYRMDSKSTEFDTPAGAVAFAYICPKPSLVFDDLVKDLRKQTSGSEAGILIEQLIQEIPLEVARYIRGAMDNRRNLIGVIADRRDIVELVRVKKDDGNFVLHHINCPAEMVEALSE